MADQDREARPEYWTRDDAARHLARLSGPDLYRLERIARARSAGLPVDWQDLIQEAFIRILAGTRRWPVGVPLVAFIAQTMRSLANEERRQDESRRTEVSLSGSDDSSAAPVEIPDDRPSPEVEVGARQYLERLVAGFSDDEPVLHLISGYELGETSAETIARTGLSAQQYDAARKRFRRAVQRAVEDKVD